VAALSVVICHYFQIYWLNRAGPPLMVNVAPLPAELYPTPSYVPWISDLPFFSYGAFGVGLFFIVSGFVIPFALSKYDPGRFLVSRFLRLYPTYWAGLSIGMLAVLAGGLIHHRPFPHTAAEIGWQYALGLRDLVGSKNLDGVIWTLEIELRFYLLCACVVPLFRSRSTRILILPLTLFGMCLALAPFVAPTAPPSATLLRIVNVMSFDGRFLLFMFIGVVLNRHYQGLLSSSATAALVLAIHAGFCILILMAWNAGDFRQPLAQLWGYGLATLVFCLSYLLPKPTTRGLPRLIRFLADISYPLYVVHTITGFLILRQMHGAGVDALPALGITLTVVFAISAALHRWVEVPAQAQGRQIARNAAFTRRIRSAERRTL
jgi:peptidoglycan/LPS O-acetylase OafA/YrhL